MNRIHIFLACFLGIVAAGTTSATAQTNSFQQTNLVSDLAGSAAHTDPTLIAPWGIAIGPAGQFWIANNRTAFATTYDKTGSPQLPLAVGIPPHAGSRALSMPSAVVGNPFAQSGDFQLNGLFSQVLFASADGTISGWGPDTRGDFPVDAAIAIDHSASGAVYTGIAIAAPACCREFLVVANFHSGLIETYTPDFAPLAPPGSFTDPELPAGYAPFGIQVVGSFVFVTYAVQDVAKQNPVPGPGNGLVNIFDLEGNFVGRFASNGQLNAPWGIAHASASFGPFANDILVGNFGDGTINAFDPGAGTFQGALKDGTGATIINAGLWGLTFGSGGTGDPDSLYFTAAVGGGTHGLFGAITATTPATPDFSLAAVPSSATVMAGQSTTFRLDIGSLGGFSDDVTFSCAAPTGVTCAFNPPTVRAAADGISTTLTTTTSASVMNYSNSPNRLMAGMLFTGFGLIGCFVYGAKRSKTVSSAAAVAVCLVALATLTMSTACGGYKSSGNRGTAAIVVTAASGDLSHTTTLSLTVQ